VISQVRALCGAEILLSLRPIYAERILMGTKGYEFRRVMPGKPVSRVWIYATMPVGRVVGWFDVAAVLSGPPAELWEHTHAASGVTPSEFRGYFEGVVVAHAFAVGAREWFGPVDPRVEWPGFRAPQSFRYMEGIKCV
jgi:predicted transcriptional regulator